MSSLGVAFNRPWYYRREVTIQAANDAFTTIGPSPDLPRRFIVVAVCAVFILGVFTRIDSLSTSLWLDEFGTLWVVEGSFTTMLHRTWEFQGQSPFYYSLAWLSVQALGESEIALRTPSLLLSCLTAVMLYVCGRRWSGPGAGLYAAALFWLPAFSVRYSVEARPYMLVLCTVAVAIAGFVCAVHSGTWRPRIVWILGGAGVAWTHYVHFPVIVGLYVAYALLPALRVQYRVRAFITDAALQLALVGLCAPQIVALFNRRAGLSWIDTPNYAVFLEPLVPLAGGIVIGLMQPWRDDSRPIKAALANALLICVLFHIVIIESASMLGMNLLNIRYFVSILIPATLFVAVTLARVSTAAVVSILTVFALATATPLIVAKKLTGTFSGLGIQNWGDAVQDVSGRIQNEPKPLVFFRSGFVEEDNVPLGAPPPTTLAPLRSPGERPFRAPVIPLNYRWAHPFRETYFDERIAPLIDSAGHFFVLGTRIDPGGGSYMDLFAGWVNSKWPSRFTVARTDYGRVELLEFRARTAPPDAYSGRRGGPAPAL